MLRQSKKSYGYKDLLVYKKSEELQGECSLLTSHFPHSSPSTPLIPLKTLSSLSDQMNRSARSVKQNIVEGWKRNSTKEYYDFLGFSIGALTELEEDCNDIWKGIYPELMGIRGVMGAMGEMGVKGVMGNPINPINPINPPSPPLSNPLNPSYPSSLPLTNPLNPISSPFDIEKIPFYPLDKNLPPIIQLKLRCKELNYLLKKLQDSLSAKMGKEKTLSAQDKYSLIKKQQQKADQFEKEIMEKYGIEDKRV